MDVPRRHACAGSEVDRHVALSGTIATPSSDVPIVLDCEGVVRTSCHGYARSEISRRIARSDTPNSDGAIALDCDRVIPTRRDSGAASNVYRSIALPGFVASPASYGAIVSECDGVIMTTRDT